MDTRKLEAPYFWNDYNTYEEAEEAARRWNAFAELIEKLQAFVNHTEFVGNIHLAVYLEAKEIPMDTLTIEQQEKHKIVAAYVNHPIYKSWLNFPETNYPYWHLPAWHSSYDALMPIVKKIMYRPIPAVPLSIIGDIKTALQSCYEDIIPLYNATVAAIIFINSLNEVK